MSYFKKDDNMEKRMIIAVGLVIAVVFMVAGTQMSIRGREYERRVKLLEVRGYEIDTTVAWSGIDEYEEGIRTRFKNAVDVERREIEDWAEFYQIFRDSLTAPVYDSSIYDYVHCSDDEYVIWFSTVNLRGSSQGKFTTYYIFPDG